MSQEREGRKPATKLGLLDATMIGMGAMIGAGIFVLTGIAAEIAGPAAILVFFLNGIVTTFTGLSYAELASSIPKSGGGYAFVREVFKDLSSFIMGWMLSFAYMIAGGLYALGFASNFIEFIHIYWQGLPSGPLFSGFISYSVVYAFLSIGGFVLLNIISTKASGGAETIITIIKILILLIFSAFGAFTVKIGNFTPILPGNRTSFSILSAMGLTFIAFEGYDLITTVTEEVKNPRKNIPKAIFISLIFTVFIYLLVVFIAIGNLGFIELGRAGETGIARAAEDFMPTIPILGTGASVIAFGAVFSTLSALNAVVIASSRVIFAMGREQQLPNPIGKISAKYGTPIASLFLTSIVMITSVIFLPIQIVGKMASLFFLLSFIVVNISVIRLRIKRPDMERPYEMPFYPIPPILGIIFNIILAYFLMRDDLLIFFLGAGWIILGIFIFHTIKYIDKESIIKYIYSTEN